MSCKLVIEAASVEWWFTRSSWRATGVDARPRSSKPRLCYVQRDCDPVRRQLQYCVNLQHLRLDEASENERSDLLQALECSHLRARLLTLNLNDQSIDDAGLMSLSSILADSTTLVALEELRVNYRSTACAPITSLYDLLSVNRTLRLVELFYARQETHPVVMGRHRERLEEETRLDAAFQGQLLDTYSPMDVKLGFLSVVNSPFVVTRNHGRLDRLALPESLLSRILGFAATLETRRVIAWNPSECYGQTW